VLWAQQGVPASVSFLSSSFFWWVIHNPAYTTLHCEILPDRTRSQPSLFCAFFVTFVLFFFWQYWGLNSVPRTC
jgi:hypothetical protein